MRPSRSEDTQAADWTTAPADEVPDWRRSDRERLDAARALEAEADSDRVEANARARRIHALAQLHHDGRLTSEEFLGAVRICLN